MAESPSSSSKGAALPLPQDDRIGHFIQGILQQHAMQPNWTHRPADPSVSPGTVSSAATVHPSPKDSGVDMNSPIHREDAVHTDHENDPLLHPPKAREMDGPGSVESGTVADPDVDLVLNPPCCPADSLFASSVCQPSCSISTSTVPIPSSSSTVADLSQMWASTSQSHMLPSSTPAVKAGMDEDLRLFAHDLLLSDFSDCEPEESTWSFSAGLTSNCESPSPTIPLNAPQRVSSQSSSSAASVSGFAEQFHKFVQQEEKVKLKRTRKRKRASSEAEELPVLKLKRMSSGTYTAMSPTSPLPVLSPVSVTPKTPLLRIKFGSLDNGEHNMLDVHHQDLTSPPLMLRPEMSSESFPLPPNDFNVEHHIACRAKLQKFCKKLLILCKLLFPSLQLRSKDCAQISCLMDQIISAAKETPPPSFVAIPPSCCGQDVRVVLCSSPKVCLKHLRKKACRLLQALLPGLVLSSTVDGSLVEELLHKVYSANKQHQASSGDVT